MENPDRKCNVLIVDTGAILRDASALRSLATEFVTVAEVISEVRDKRTRQLLETLPFDLKVRMPSAEAVKKGKQNLC